MFRPGELTREQARMLNELWRKVENLSNLRVSGLSTFTQRSGQTTIHTRSPEQEYVQVNSIFPHPDGYDGTLVTYNQFTDTWEEKGSVYLLDINAEFLIEQRYPAWPYSRAGDRPLYFTGQNAEASLESPSGEESVPAAGGLVLDLTPGYVPQADAEGDGLIDGNTLLETEDAAALFDTYKATVYGRTTHEVTTSNTSGANTGWSFISRTTGTAAAGFGTAIRLIAEDASGDTHVIGLLQATYVDATHASYTAQVTLVAGGSAGTVAGLAVGVTSLGAPQIAFLGGTLAAKQTGDAATALETYNLLTSGTYAASRISGSISKTQVSNTGTWETSEIPDLSATYALAVHTHTLSDITDAGTAAAADTGDFAAAVHAHAASDITSGTVATVRLGSGTADATTFLRGDSTWTTAVTSVALTFPAQLGTVSGSPITGSGTLAVSLTNRNANWFFAGPATGAAAVPSFRTIVAADLPVFVQAGGGTAKGAVPAPGGTAHANRPYVLGDNAAWHNWRGELIGRSYVSTDEATTSTSAVDLATVHSITFTLDEITTLLIRGTVNYYNSSTADVGQILADIDGVDVILGETKVPAAVAPLTAGGALLSTLAAGSHTVKMQFLVAGGTGRFRWRLLEVWRAP